MEFEYQIVDRTDMILLGMSSILLENTKDDLYRFFDGIVADGTYRRLFAAQTKNIGEWNVYTSSADVEGTGRYVFMVATEISEFVDLARLHGMKLEFMHIKPAKWMVIRGSGIDEVDRIHKRTIEQDCIRDVGYAMDFEYQKPIMEFQPVPCTKNPPYIDFMMPVKAL